MHGTAICTHADNVYNNLCIICLLINARTCLASSVINAAVCMHPIGYMLCV